MLFVSLTTIPSRIPLIRPTLISLATQTITGEPYKIYLNIPWTYKTRKFRDNENFLEEHIKALEFWKEENRFPITINRVKDYGPATKLLGMWDIIKEEDKVVIVDDDRVYDEYLLQRLVGFSRRFPDYIITESGWTITGVADGVEYKKQGFVDVLGGCCGALVKKRFFHQDVVDIPDTFCFFVDDFWFSGHAKVPIYTTGDQGVDAARHVADSVDSLCDEKAVGRQEANVFAIEYFRCKFRKWS